jgi:membrane protease YdiL (CAAX protease family)
MDVELAIQPPPPVRAPVPDPAGEPIRSAIKFRHIALLLLGGIVSGCFVGILAGVLAYGFTHSMFVAGAVGGSALYAALIVGYHWTSQERGWAGLRTRFASVGPKPLIVGASTAVAVFAYMAVLVSLLTWAGVKLADVPSPIELDRWTQLPLALVFIAVFAPFTEELLFRGLLLDWLKEKMNVWPAAVILSVIFSLLHANPFSLGAVGWLAFTDRFLLGMGASALTIKYHSLRPAFAMHATWNAIAGFASVLSSG